MLYTVFIFVFDKLGHSFVTSSLKVKIRQILRNFLVTRLCENAINSEISEVHSESCQTSMMESFSENN